MATRKPMKPKKPATILRWITEFIDNAPCECKSITFDPRMAVCWCHAVRALLRELRSTLKEGR